ncbi:MAG: protein kinase [Micromonosporaceae bacterium]|nr:protein kinase [Micromonosporaceae bacterium]
MSACVRPECHGSYGPDGYCDECGFKAPYAVTPGAASVATAPGSAAGPVTVPASGAATAPATVASTGSATSRRRSRASGSRRLGAGLLEVPRVAPKDPASAVLADPQVPESRRVCLVCEQPVGRGRDGQPGLTEGFCPRDRSPYFFTPALVAGDKVAGRYEILGCLAYGGFGWIYLARDENVSDDVTDRWVVLKGLINTGDPDAIAAAIAERRSLVGLDHPAIVKIYDFVQHPDPRTNAAQGYIVMEYLGGKSVREVAREHRGPDGRPAPLPLAQALAYALEALPALGYLHDNGLLYCDLKPDNLMQVDDLIKVIDLGGVTSLDEDATVVYGTPGFQAPEIAERGPSIASDIYTVGRTLAVLTLGREHFRDKASRHRLPDPSQAPLLAREESYHRLLRRAADPDPDRRFASADEMREQALGVLREVLSAHDDQPRPAASGYFTPPRHTFGAELGALPPPKDPGTSVDCGAVAAALPTPQVDAADPAAGFLATLGAAPPGELMEALRAAPVDSPEVSLRLIGARVARRELRGATADLDAYQREHPDDWRVWWHRGLIALAGREPGAAHAAFDRVYDELPGELAPQLALAAAAEWDGDADGAAWRYQRVWRTDRGFVSAGFGWARQRWQAGDFSGAAAVLDEVPQTSSQHLTAQIAAVLARLAPPASEFREADLLRAGGRAEQLDLDAERRARLTAEVLGASLAWVQAGRQNGDPGGPRRVLDCPMTERDLRFGLEQVCRDLAKLADDPQTRVRYVDQANQIRPRTWW